MVDQSSAPLPPGYPSDYPPAPPPPVEAPPLVTPPSSQAPYPTYPYAPPAYGMSLPPARGTSRGLWLIVSGILVVLVLVLGFGGYAVAAFSTTNARLSAARHAISAATDHRTAFDNMPTTFVSSASDVAAMQSDADTFLSSWQQQKQTVMDDDAALATASRKLGDPQWLTFLGQNQLDQSAQRLSHARKALAAAATMADYRIQEGRFLQAFATAVGDEDTVANDGQAGDLPGAAAAATKLSSDIGAALQMAGAPGLPPEVHQFLVQYKQLADDLILYIQASIKGDKTTAAQLMTTINNDDDALQAISTDNVEAEIAAFYNPYIRTYHSELSLAQS